MNTYEELEAHIIAHVDPAIIQAQSGPEAVVFWFVARTQAVEFMESGLDYDDIAYYFQTGIDPMTKAGVTRYLEERHEMSDEDVKCGGEPWFEDDLECSLEAHFGEDWL